MYEDKMMDLFVKNQLIINPHYEGEIITFNGKQYNLSEKAQELGSGIKQKTGSSCIELLCCYILNNTRLTFTSSTGKATLSQVLYPYRLNLPVKKKAETFIDSIHQIVCKEIEKFIITPEEDEFIQGCNIFIKDYSRDKVKEALYSLVGLNSIRPIYNMTKSSLNGNIIDILPDNFKYLSKVKVERTSLSNLMRAVGIPYSDYRLFLSTGALVSTSLDNFVYIVKNEYLFCCTIKDFQSFLDDNTITTRWVKNFAETYHPSDLAPGTKMKWELPIR